MDGTGDGSEGERLLHRLLARRGQHSRRIQHAKEKPGYLGHRARETSGPARSFGFLIAVTTVYFLIGGSIAALFGAATWGLADYFLDGQAKTLGHEILVIAGLALALCMCCLCGYTTVREIRRDWARFNPPSWWPIRSRLG